MSEDQSMHYLELLDQGQVDVAYTSCLEQIKASPDEETRQMHQASLCHILNEMGRYDESDRILSELYDKSPDSYLLHNWAAVKRMKGLYQEALDMFQVEREMIADSNDSLLLGTNCYEVSKVNHMLGNMELALIEAQRCFYYSQQSDDLVGRGCACRLLGDVYFSYSPDTSLHFYRLAIDWFSKANNPAAITDVKKRQQHVQEGRDPKFFS